MYFEDIAFHAAVDIPGVTIEKEKMLDFARLYDPSPLHTDENYAKSTHYGGLIAPGVMSFMTVWAKYIEYDFFGAELVGGKSAKIEWFLPVYAGDVLKGKAVVTNKRIRNEKNGIVELTISVRNQKGALVLTNVTEAVVKRKTAPKRTGQ